jgi:uncharacterized protein YndB with AHSA1/START domain
MIDVTRQVGAVTRTVSTASLPEGEARVGTISQVYPTGIEDLWEAVTSAERIPRWFLPVSGELKLGGHYQLEGNAGGTITDCEPPHRYAATWEFADQVSWITVRLTPEGDGTRFELEHVAHVAGEFWDQFGPTATGIGWEMGLLGLAGHLAGDAGLTPEEGAAWAASAEGREFTARSSDGWCAAYVASGADPAVARGMADRTTAAYTGVPEEAV